MDNRLLPIAIIGGGPVGLAAAAHLATRQQKFVVLEKGAKVGASILTWGQVKMFSPWQYNIDKAAEALLLKNGWVAPDKNRLPTGQDLVNDYLLPLSEMPELQKFIQLNSQVTAISRRGLDKQKSHGRDKYPFLVRYVQDGVEKTVLTRAIIDATGTWTSPNPITSDGVLTAGEKKAQAHIFYGIPDVLGKAVNRFANKTIAVIGSGHSAINTILDLSRLQKKHPETIIHWVLRKQEIQAVFGGKQNDELPARGALGIRIEKLVNRGKIHVHTPFYIETVQINAENLITLQGWQANEIKTLNNIAEIIVNTGSRPDTSFLQELRVSFDSITESVPALADLIDPNHHSCGTVKPHGEAELRQLEKDVYIVGMKSYGRAPTFLLATGYEQVRSITAALSGDWEAAKKVALSLPETGVCSSGIGGGGCCDSPISSIPIVETVIEPLISLDTITVQPAKKEKDTLVPIGIFEQKAVTTTTSCCEDSCC